MYDYLIVGTGLFGSVFARELTNNGNRVLVIDKRNHIGGNCYTENVGGIHVHKYGPHIFHTSNKEIWDYVNKLTTFNSFSYRPKVNYKGSIYSFPINLMTLYQVYGVTTPTEALKILESKKVNIPNPTNLEEWCLSQIGNELYEIFIKGYTSPRAQSDYNLALGKRRVASARLHFEQWREGVLQPYINSGQLKIAEVSFGETRSATGISDDLTDERGSIYSPAAARERRVEIVSVKED